MLIQICITRADIPATGEGIAFVRGEIGPKVAAMNGSRGFLMAMDRSSGCYIAMAAWSDRETLEAHDDLAPGLIADATRHLDSSEPTVEVFDLVVSHVAKPVRIGYWGRLVQIRVPAEETHRAAQRFRDTIIPGHEHDDGLAGIALLLNHETGAGYAASWYDSLPRLAGSRAGGQESGQLLIAGLPAFTAIETTEVEVVISEPSPPTPGASSDRREPGAQEFLTSYP